MTESKKSSAMLGNDSKNSGLLERAVNSSADLAEKTVIAVFEVARDIGNEVNGRTTDTLAWLEALPRTAFKVARDTNERIHRLTLDALEASEGISLQALRTVRITSQSAAEMAARTTAALIAVRKEQVTEAA
jgi:hypothetical protein